MDVGPRLHTIQIPPVWQRNNEYRASTNSHPEIRVDFVCSSRAPHRPTVSCSRTYNYGTNDMLMMSSHQGTSYSQHNNIRAETFEAVVAAWILIAISRRYGIPSRFKRYARCDDIASPPRDGADTAVVESDMRELIHWLAARRSVTDMHSGSETKQITQVVVADYLFTNDREDIAPACPSFYIPPMPPHNIKRTTID